MLGATSKFADEAELKENEPLFSLEPNHICGQGSGQDLDKVEFRVSCVTEYL